MTDFKDIGMLAAGDRVRIRNAIAKLAGRQSPNRPRTARTLRDHADWLFLDAECKERFPLTLPALSSAAWSL
jgi:hypothetical protein